MIFLFPEFLLLTFCLFLYFFCKNPSIQIKSRYDFFTINNFKFALNILQIFERFKTIISLLILFSGLSLFACCYSLENNFSSYNFFLSDTEYLISNFELFFKIVLLLFFLVCMFFFVNSEKYCHFKNYILSTSKFTVTSFVFSCEFLLLICFFCLAGCSFISAENLFTLFLSKECQTLILCFLIVYCNTKSAAKSALYFFFQAAFYSFLFLLGMAIIYFDVGTLNFKYILDYVLFFQATDLSIFWLKIGFLLILFSFGFKLGVPPFNFWVLNIFSVVPRIVIFVVSILSKVIVFSFFFKLNVLLYYLFEFDFNFFALIGAFSLVYSSLAGLIEYNLFRIFAFSSFNHLGLLLMGLSFNNLIGLFAVFFYLVIYLMNSLFFLIASVYKKNFINIFSFSYHFYVDPWFCLVFCIILLSMSGIPPFIGFFPKMMIGILLYNYSLFVNSSYFFYFFLFIVTSTLVLVLYLRIVRIIFFGGYKYLKFYNYSFPATVGNVNNMWLLYLFLLFNILVIISVSWVFGLLFDFFYDVY